MQKNNDKRGTLYCGDCLEILEQRIEPESVDLIYLDPPFFSNRNYEVIWGDKEEIRSFVDRWEGGIEVYAAWMGERLRACHRVLKPTGSIYLHCDWHANHYLRMKLDEIFGSKNFLNEIIWCYTIGGKSKRSFGRKHDNIYLYTKTPNKSHCFNVKAASIPRKPNSHMRSAVDADGRQYQEKTDRKTGKVYRYYMDEGKIAEDYWTDIEALNRKDRERLGYPTQKPEALLARIIGTSSKEGDVVLDPFCGCGTTVSVANKFGRTWIGVDISPTAVELVRKRVTVGPEEIEVIGMPTSLDQLKAMTWKKFQHWVVRERFNGTLGPNGPDKGVDGFTFMLHEPIQVKHYTDATVGRPAIDSFASAVRRVRKKKGFVVAFSFTKQAIEECARLKRESGLEIQLVKVEDILNKGIDQ